MSVLKKFVLPNAVLLVGLVIAVTLVVLKPRASKKQEPRTAPPVALLLLEPALHDPVVHSSGVVEPDQRITLVPQVSGRVQRLAEGLRPGGRFAQGDALIWLDPREYRLAIEQESSRVRQAELELALEQGRQQTAQREWELLGSELPADQAELALRQPHLANAVAALASARAGLERAELNLERTVLRAPFNASVLDEQVDPGQVVAPGAPVATLVGTDRVRVNVSLPLAEVALLQVPGFNAEQGSHARVLQRLEDGSQVEHSGLVAGLAGELDPQARTARLMVLVDDPMGGDSGALPLMPGAWVDVQLEGQARDGIVRLHREAVFEGDSIWVVDGQQRLAKRELQVAWRTPEAIFASAGWRPGERLVPTPPSLAVEGLAVRLEDDGMTCVIGPDRSVADASSQEGAEPEVATP